MAEFAYNNAKNASTGHTPFELNCGYHPKVSFKENVDPRSRSRSANELVEELRELMEVCCQNLSRHRSYRKEPMTRELRAKAMLRARKSG